MDQSVTAHSTTISAAALAARVTALEAQLEAAQRDNTRLIARIVELEHERDAARHGEIAAVHGRIAFRGGFRKMRDERNAARRWAAVWKAKAYKERRKADNWQDSWLRAVGMAARAEHERDIASQLAAMTIQERLDAGHPITFAGDAAPPTQEGGNDE